MTFCPFYEKCKKVNCIRALTPEIRSRAQAANFPIAQWTKKPECFEEESCKDS